MYPSRETPSPRYCLTERGHIAVYGLLLLPVVMTMLTLIVDLSGYYTLRNRIQQEADSIALLSVRSLPDISVAQMKAQLAFSRLSSLGIDGELSTGAAVNSGQLSVSITLQAAYRPTFDYFIKVLAPSSRLENGIEIRHQATAQVTPIDALLIVADGFTLRPGILPGASPSQTTYEAPWGTVSEWPASGYFNCVSGPTVLSPTAAPLLWWEHWQEEAFRRWLTQSCFNPSFSALKFAAISLVDSLSSQRANRVGVVFTPGSENSIDPSVIRHVYGEHVSSTGTTLPHQIGGFFHLTSPRAEADWLSGLYRDEELFAGDELCVLLSDSQTAFSSRYQLPQAPTLWRFARPLAPCGPTVAISPCGRRHAPFHLLNQCYLENNLTLREALYWRAARRPTASFSARPDIIAAIERGISELIHSGAPSFAQQTKYEVQERGQIAYASERQILALSDVIDVPSVSRLTSLLSSLSEFGIRLTIVGYEHPGLSTEELQDLRNALTTITDISERYYAREERSASIQLLRARSPEDLIATVVPRLLTSARKVSLRS